ncbi:MAG: arsenite efflux transporter metallochaperone ArsD [Rhizobiales bacterium]|nr:arsenite efflux transporter metallochaperone ArsD [Hyphomicrobiales bacterium]
MTTIAVYDPPMCCSSGVCGPDADASLVQFAANLEAASRNGVTVKRFNLGHEPAAFATSQVVRPLLEREGMECLPIVLIDDVVVSKGAYPSGDEMARRLGTSSKPAAASTGCCGASSSKQSSCCS